MCERLGLGVITWAPMAMGVLAGRYLSESDYPENSRAALRGGFYADRVTRAGIEVGREFARIAADSGLTPAQFAILWSKDQPGSVVADFPHTADWMKMTVLPPAGS